ncbi:MAG: NAD-dependent epimerase/dehydratase family protein [Acidimicrobiia bacterium]|nr:NAD-dependent epimerase/dehydratase family protein [Acidimicrobiia bacterium]MBT8217986.1 NAD-dependent epimerase/dehydratase family protein [Acidimicrobiia bacterium]NNF09215.1 NAD-dependent epimerase/dehydratase family protein [Acidimicrobiia bacterium]NNL69638.1 NAD-dependent epimerase/dehydratase family protein [Acidimicrobiia bacterium]
MSRALVTGGAGFLGRRLSARLLDEGFDVVVLDNLSSPSPLGPPDGATFIEGTVVDPPSIDGPIDRIYHLASPASPPRYLLDPIGTLRTGGEGTRQMLDLAEDRNARFLLASTSEVYGDPTEHPQREEYTGSVQVTSTRACYDEAKRYAEALTYAYHRTGRVGEVRVVRIFNTYGPGMAPDDGRVVSNFINQALAGQPLTIYGDGSQTRSFCYLDDLIEGIWRLSASDVDDPVNIGNPEEMSMKELASVIASEISDTGIDYRPLPESDPARRRPDITRAQTLLGWEPRVGFIDGLPPTIDYFRSLADG